MKIVVRFEKQNRYKSQTRLLEIYNIIAQGYKSYLTWIELKSEEQSDYSEAFRKAKAKDAEENMKAVLKKIGDLDRKYFVDSWKTKWIEDFNKEKSLVQRKSNQEIATHLLNVLSNKYDFRDWVVLVYNSADALDIEAHYIHGICPGSHAQIQFGNGKNIVVMNIDPTKKSFASPYTKAHTKNVYNHAYVTTKDHSKCRCSGNLGNCHCPPDAIKGMERTDLTFFHINKANTLPISCSKYLMSGFVRKSLQPVVRCTRERCYPMLRWETFMVTVS